MKQIPLFYSTTINLKDMNLFTMHPANIIFTWHVTTWCERTYGEEFMAGLFDQVTGDFLLMFSTKEAKEHFDASWFEAYVYTNISNP